MHDSRIEELLRGALHAEAANLPFPVSVGQLERRAAERRRSSGVVRRQRTLAAAVAAIVISGGGAMALLFANGQTGLVGTTPVPSGTASPLPSAATLLADFPNATLLLEHSHDGGDAGPIPPVDVGQVTIDAPLVIASVCEGPGDFTLHIDDGTGTDFIESTTPCDGAVYPTEYLSDLPAPGPEPSLVTVTASPEASWRLAVGAYPRMEAPPFPRSAVTDGWTKISEVPRTLISPTTGSGVGFQTPAGATEIGITVTCQGLATIRFELAGEAIDSISCTDAASTHRFEIAPTPGERVRLAAKADAFVWFQMLAEFQGEVATTYPKAPALPAAVLDTPYASSNLVALGVGTIGGNRQTVLPVAQTQPGAASGSIVPVAIFDTSTGSTHLDVRSVSDGEVLARVASVDQPGMIVSSWADAEHGQVYYSVIPDQASQAVEYHRVGIDGSGDTIIAQSSIGADLALFGRSAAAIALDGSAFVVDICEDGQCRFQVFDTTTGTVSQVEHEDGPICALLGVADGLVVAATQPVCAPFDLGADPDEMSILALPLEGGASRELVQGSMDGEVVETPTGARLIHVRPSAAGTDVRSVDIATGEETVLVTRADDEPVLAPVHVRLPSGWVLLATFSLGDYPQASPVDRAVPILVNLVTGEQFEMVNLPH
jgi:hypothetical protein